MQNARKDTPISWGSGTDLLFVAVGILVAGFFAKLPMYVDLPELGNIAGERFQPTAAHNYYARNMGFFILPVLIVFFCWEKSLRLGQTLVVVSAILISFAYINYLPGVPRHYGDTVTLAFIHAPLFLWFVMGMTYVQIDFRALNERLEFLRYSSDLIVLSVLILLAGMILTLITVALFSTINLNIYEFYYEYVVVYGLVGAPIVANYIICLNPTIVRKISPLIARIFSPLILITVVAYLISAVYAGKDPYNDREFLLVFNWLLILVMAIVIFSIVELRQRQSKWNLWFTTLLVITTIVVDAVALSGIGYRILEWGFTPNRIVVLGENILILTHLILIMTGLAKLISKKQTIQVLDSSVLGYFPIYGVWTAFVVFIFPVAHGFK